MCRVAVLALLIVCVSAIRGQEPPKLLPDLSTDKATAARTQKTPLPRHLQPIDASSARGMGWLQRANQPDGKFLSGFIPALAIKADGDPFGPQTEAALALIRAARYHGDDRALVLGKQALLRLLQDTTTDTTQPTIRFTSAPDPFVNRLAACGGLLQAIYELPNPPDDLRGQALQLANYLRTQLQSDGTFVLGADDAGLKLHLLHTCTGPALAGLRAFERFEMPNKKIERTQAALFAHHALWRQSKNPSMIPGMTAACRATIGPGTLPESGDVQIVFEMNDWLLTMQYSDPRQPQWAGGFMPWQNGKTSNAPPDATSAAYACSLVDACLVAKHVGDVQRLQRYRQSLEQTLTFLITLQYSEARVQHYADWFRPWILGGFYNSPQDGNLRLTSTANATAAMAGYLEHFGK